MYLTKVNMPIGLKKKKILILSLPMCLILDFSGGSVVQNLPDNSGDTGLIPGSGRPLEKEMAAHSSVLAWEIPWAEESGGL